MRRENIILTIVLLLALPCALPALADTNDYQAYGLSLLTKVYGLPIIQGGKSGNVVVSEEEKVYLEEEQRRQNSVLLKQLAFPELEDHVLYFPEFEPNDTPPCPLPYSYLDYFLEEGLWKQLPGVCYKQYTSYIHYPQNTGSPQADHTIETWAKERQKKNDACLITYFVGRPSPKYISLAFCKTMYWRDSHLGWLWTMQSYDLKTGHALELSDVFPDMENSAPLLEAYIYKQLWPERQDLEWLRRLNPIDMRMDRLFLMPDGLYAVYYDISPEVDIKFAHIPVTDLPGIGGNTVFWEK